MDETYEIKCDVCDSVVEILVFDNEEEPEYCPMCGTTL
jgi:ribosomal protein S27E